MYGMFLIFMYGKIYNDNSKSTMEVKMKLFNYKVHIWHKILILIHGRIINSINSKNAQYNSKRNTSKKL